MKTRYLEDKETLPLILFDTLGKENLDEFKESIYKENHEMVFRFFIGKNQKKYKEDYRSDLTNVEERLVPNEERYHIFELSFCVYDFSFLVSILTDTLFDFNVGSHPIIYEAPIHLFYENTSMYKIRFVNPVIIERNQHYNVSIKVRKEIFDINTKEIKNYKEDFKVKCMLFGVTERMFG